MLCPLHSNKNKEQYTKSISAINPVAIENNPNSQHSHREATTCYRELTPCVVNKQNTKKDKDKSMMCVLYVLQLAKGHISGKRHQTVKKSIIHCQVILGWRYQSVNQSVRHHKILLLNRKFLKFHRSFFEGFGVWSEDIFELTNMLPICHEWKLKLVLG